MGFPKNVRYRYQNRGSEVLVALRLVAISDFLLYLPSPEIEHCCPKHTWLGGKHTSNITRERNVPPPPGKSWESQKLRKFTKVENGNGERHRFRISGAQKDNPPWITKLENCCSGRGGNKENWGKRNFLLHFHRSPLWLCSGPTASQSVLWFWIFSCSGPVNIQVGRA